VLLEPPLLLEPPEADEPPEPDPDPPDPDGFIEVTVQAMAETPRVASQTNLFDSHFVFMDWKLRRCDLDKTWFQEFACKVA
jgi:hypothetical protein